MTTRRLARAMVTMAVLAAPASAAAQRQPFIQAVAELTEAAEGVYGDEGPRIGRALDAMAAALTVWDGELPRGDGDVSAAAPAASSRPAAGVTVARWYVSRGQRRAALDHLEPLSAAGGPDVDTLRGLLLDAEGDHSGAAAAFQRARVHAPDDPALAYYAWRAARAAGESSLAGTARAALLAAYPRQLQEPHAGLTALPRPITLDGRPEVPLVPLAAYRRGFERLARGELRAALDEFRRAAAADPLVSSMPAPSAPRAHAIAALRQGRLADARALLEPASAADGSPEANRVLGLVYWAASDFDRSITQFRIAIRQNPDDERSRLALSRVLDAAGRDDDARRVLQDTLRIIPASARARWWLAAADERANRSADARAAYEQAAAAAVTGRSRLLATIGRLASAAADAAGAIHALDRAVADDPANPEWHRLLAGAFLLDDRPDDALAEFVAILLIAPGDGGAHFGIGQILLNAGRTAEAGAALRRALATTPGSVEAEYALATALTRLGEDREAAGYFAHVAQVQQARMAERRRRLSLDALREEATLRIDTHDYARAITLWRQVLEEDDGQRASDHAALAAALTGAGRLDDAIAAYERAVALGADPATYLRLADLYAQAGRAADAARARVRYEAALRDGSGGR